MLANAYGDGRPAGHNWRPLFKATCLADADYLTAVSNAAKTQNPLKLACVTQNSGPKFTIL